MKMNEDTFEHNKKQEKKILENREDLFYILGVFCNRGNIKDRRLALETSDEDLAKIVKNKLEKISNNVRIKEKRRKDKIYYLVFANLSENYLKIFQDIRAWIHYLEEIKESIALENIAILDEYSNLRIMFLRGFFDAKGFLNVVYYYDKKENRKKRKIRIRASSYSFNLLKLIQRMLNIESIKARVYCIANKDKKNKLYVIEIQGRNSIECFKNKIGSEREDKKEELASILRY
ncbi:MAG: LAGLIDADG family homing endonuclease [Candidatus Aenigmatarchaeota archaeon]